MKKVGLEKEFFLMSAVLDQQPQVIPPILPADECGFLVEARGEPFRNIVDAVFGLQAEIYRIVQRLPDGMALSDDPVMKVSRDLRREAARVYAKGLVSYQNLYGFKAHRNSQSEHTAGVHISFSHSETVSTSSGGRRQVLVNWDWPVLFRQLDLAFAEEIKSTKRRPGFYEVKPDGRVEYRSLPSNVDLDKVMEVLSRLGW